MYLVDEADQVPVRTVEDCVAYFRTAGKPRDQWRIGTEHELIGVRAHGPKAGTAPGYDDPDGIGTILKGYEARGWRQVVEEGNTIALTRGDAQVTLEPGGQFELAARPIGDDRVFSADLREHVRTLAEVTRPLGLAWLSSGLRPFGVRDDIPWMPKARYRVMRAYMPTVGTRGLDMMLRTATVQTNLDYADEADAAEKLRALNATTSILTALWANSPLTEGQPNGFQSYRAWIWRDTDSARCGLSRFAFERGDVFRAYADWALDVPMYFVYRGGYQPAGGMTFRTFMRDGWRGEHASRGDWALHLSTMFPEARLKRLIEVRGCDCGSLPMIEALGPFCRGLLYDDAARDAAIALTAGLSWEERQRLADEVPKTGLKARAGAHTLGELAKELVAIAKAGLVRVAPEALSLIEPVEEIALTGRTQALVAGACGSSDKPAASDGSGSVDVEAARKAAALRAEQARVENEKHAAAAKEAELAELTKQLDDLNKQAHDAMQAIGNATSKDEQDKAQARLEDLTKQRAALQQKIDDRRAR
jgi:glutamate--cysteine ligase